MLPHQMSHLLFHSFIHSFIHLEKNARKVRLRYRLAIIKHTHLLRCNHSSGGVDTWRESAFLITRFSTTAAAGRHGLHCFLEGPSELFVVHVLPVPHVEAPRLLVGILTPPPFSNDVPVLVYF